MIITRIIGGMGNQMFQYAAGLSLAMKHETVLKLDLADMGKDPSRGFELTKLNTNIIPATFEETQPYRESSLTKRAMLKLLPAHKRGYYKEPHFKADPHFQDARDGSYLKGYWQSWKYFYDIKETIQEQFRVKDEYLGGVKELGNSFRDNHTVSVHIRRGDYTSRAALKYNGLLDGDYFNSALARMKVEHQGLEVKFFSDDINWVKTHVRTDLPHEFITGVSSHSAIEDFYLMQQCRHHIIANSSFSWWAAWLNAQPGKLVIAPAKWFATSKNDTSDLFPPEWIIL